MFKRRKKNQGSQSGDYRNRGYDEASIDRDLHLDTSLEGGQAAESRAQDQRSTHGAYAEVDRLGSSNHSSPSRAESTRAFVQQRPKQSPQLDDEHRQGRNMSKGAPIARLEAPQGQFETDPNANSEVMDALNGIGTSLSGLDQRLNAMNSVLRQQAEAIDRNSESSWYFMLKSPAGVLAEVHSNLIQQIELARESAYSVDDLEFIKDGIEESLGMLGIEILRVVPGAQFSEALHRRVQVVDVDDPALSKTVRPASEGRASLAYRFRHATDEVAVRKALVTVLRHRQS